MTAASAPAIPRRRLASGAAAGLAALLIAAGLWISLHYCLTAWKADPDIATTVVLWRGVREHGLGFLKTWSYTQDNWLLSLVPIDAAVYSAFGATARVAAITGWFFFVASVGLAGWLAARLAGRRAAVALIAVLLFANYHALGHIGFLGYPISHNVSLAWGLVALLLAVSGLERGRLWPCAAAGVILYLDAVSDPWASAGIGLPLLVGAAFVAFVRRKAPAGRSALVLAGACVVALWAAYKHPFGLMSFVPRGHLELGGRHGLVANARLAWQALAVMFNIVPGGNLDALRTQIVSMAALAAVLGTAVFLTLRRLRQASAGRQLVTVVSIVSIGAVAALYLLGPANIGLYVGRFLPNLYFLGALLVTIAASAGWRHGPALAKGLLCVYAALFVASGAAMAPAAWTGPIPPAAAPDAMALGRCLQVHRLAYGYGPYWAADALAMDTLTDGAVTIRPVVFQNGRIARRPGGTSALWFQPSAEPAGASPFLVVRTDFENCPSRDDCETWARRQFGEPAARFTCGDAVILAWTRPLAPLIDP